MSMFAKSGTEMMMFLLDASVKGVIILACAGALCVLFRRASAATRHLIWGLALASVIALPVLSLALPELEARVLPASVSSTAPAEAPAEVVEARVLDAANVEAPALASVAAAAAEAEPRVVSGTPAALTEAAGPMHWSRRILLAWAIGALAACLPLMVGMISAWRMVRRARPVVAPAWDSLKRGLSRRLGLTQSVRLLESDQAIVPMTWGLWRPVILLPASAASWSNQRRRAVLLHELSHVKRGDCATQMLGRLACALWWFNPLTWYAFRRLRIESERACDDLVLGSGVSASDYAGHLLDILRTLRSPRLLASVGVCMARWSRFEGRLRAILDIRCNRRGLSKAVAVVALVVVASFVPLLSATRLAAQAVEDSDVTAEAPAEPAAEPAALDVGQLVEKLLSEDEHERIAGVTALGQMGEGARVAVEPLIAAFKDGDANVRLRAADALGKIGDARAIEPLTAALEDEDPSVRAVVANALSMIKGAEMGQARAAAFGRIKDAKTVEPLIAALKDEQAVVRSRAASALGRIGGDGAVEALAAALKDEDAGVRTAAALALAQIKDAKAAQPLIAALKDEEAGVRGAAAEALGRIRDASAVEPLIATLKDENANVRGRAAWALGYINDAKAVQPLIDALKDENAGVRSNAAQALGAIQDAKAVEPLIAALKDEDAGVRTSSVSALAGIGGEGVVEPLIAALKDEDAGVRWTAASAFTYAIAAKPIEPLIAMLKDENAVARMAAAGALGSATDARAINALIDALKDENPNFHSAVVGALRRATTQDFEGDAEKYRQWLKEREAKLAAEEAGE